MPQLADRVMEISTTTGTGSITLAGAVSGYEGFSAVFGTGSGNTFYYFIDHPANGWEGGVGYMSDATTLVRSEILQSSNSDAVVNLAAGTKDVFCSPPGERFTNWRDAVLQRPEIKDYAETVNVIGSIGGGTQDIDLSLGNVVTGTVDTSTTTFTFSNPPASGKAGSFTLVLTNGGSQTVNWPASVDFPGGTPPVLTAAGVDILVFTTVDAGTIWHGVAASTDSK